MLSRITSTVVLWLVIIGSLWLFGAHAAVALLTILSALTLYEFYGMAGRLNLRPFRWMSMFFSVLMTAGPFYLAHFSGEPDVVGSMATALLILAMLVTCTRVLGERDPTNRVETIASTMLGLFYIPFLLQFLVCLLLRDGETGDNLLLCLWVVTVSKFCDVGALLSGMAFGKHKMAPLISPKKTWEGAVGGVLISAGIGAAFAHFGRGHLPDDLTPLAAALVALPLAITTIISDLIESAIKRRADTKDTGALIPGIGGAFDLTDSLILTAPVAYFILLFFN